MPGSGLVVVPRAETAGLWDLSGQSWRYELGHAAHTPPGAPVPGVSSLILGRDEALTLWTVRAHCTHTHPAHGDVL